MRTGRRSIVVNVGAELLGEPHDDRKTAIAFDERADFLPGEREFDRAIYIIGMDVEALQGLAIRRDLEHRHTPDRIELAFSSARQTAQNIARFSRDPLQLFETVAVNLQQTGQRARRP